MENGTELRNVVYNVLLTQIQFGAYRCGEKLPTIEETSAQLRVSIDTTRTAYLRLKEQGYITLLKNVGATVRVNYNCTQAEQFIQAFFSSRRCSMLDLASSIRPLFGNAQWVGLKNASPKMLQEMQQLLCEEHTAASYAMLTHLNLKYASLGNSLLMRLVWQTFMFLYDPFFSIKENLQYFEYSSDYLPDILALCQKKDWPALRTRVNQSVSQLSAALSRFYEDRIIMPSPREEIAFTWSSYKKSQQLCYSFAMELLISISRGVYPAGTLLPSQEELARQRGVSVSTVRRALGLLGSVGAVKSAQYVGTRVLPLDSASKNIDFTNPVLRQRLVDMVESLQVFTLSCKDVSLLTFSSLDSDSVKKLCTELKVHKQWRRGEVLSYFILELLAQYAPYQAVRTVYSELLRQFFWGYALRGTQGEPKKINSTYDSYFDVLIESLEKMNFSQFASKLEELLTHELRETVCTLSRLGIPDIEYILIL